MSVAQSVSMAVVCVGTCALLLEMKPGKPKSHSSVRQTVVAVCGYCIFFAWISIKTPRPALPVCLSRGHTAISGQLRTNPGKGPVRKLKGD